MEYIGSLLNYEVYRNAEGFLEGYRGYGSSKSLPGNYAHLERIVTNAKTGRGFVEYVKGLKRKNKILKEKLPRIPFPGDDEDLGCEG